MEKALPPGFLRLPRVGHHWPMASVSGTAYPSDYIYDPGLFAAIRQVEGLSASTYQVTVEGAQRFVVQATGNGGQTVQVASFDTLAEAVTYITTDPDGLLTTSA